GVTPLPSQTVAVNGAAYRLANPNVAPPSLALAARVGDAAPTAPLTVTNASPDVYTERLNAGFGAVAGGFSGSGTITGLAAGGSSNALGAALPSQSVALGGHVYTPAIAQTNTTIVDFGIVHRGDVVADRAVS